MPSQTIDRFLGSTTKGDKKDISEYSCVRQKNCVCTQGQFSTRSGYKKINSTEYGARINMVYGFKRITGSDKTLICAGGSLHSE